MLSAPVAQSFRCAAHISEAQMIVGKSPKRFSKLWIEKDSATPLRRSNRYSTARYRKADLCYFRRVFGGVAFGRFQTQTTFYFPPTEDQPNLSPGNIIRTRHHTVSWFATQTGRHSLPLCNRCTRSDTYATLLMMWKRQLISSFAREIAGAKIGVLNTP